jgi:hypothetical protein
MARRDRKPGVIHARHARHAVHRHGQFRDAGDARHGGQPVRIGQQEVHEHGEEEQHQEDFVQLVQEDRQEGQGLSGTRPRPLSRREHAAA